MANCATCDTGVLGSITSFDCPSDMGQVVRFAVTKGANTIFPLTVGNTASDDPSLSAFWAVQVAAADPDKTVFLPALLRDPLITAGDLITEGGGDNSTPGGVVNINGRGPAVFTADFQSLHPQQEREIHDLFCQVQRNGKVFIIDEFGGIWGWSKDSGTTFDGIPASAFGIKDRDNRGANSRDINSMQFTFGKDWSKYLYRITPETAFNPITF